MGGRRLGNDHFLRPSDRADIFGRERHVGRTPGKVDAVAADSPGSDLSLAIAMGSSGVIAAILTGDAPGTTVAVAAAPLLVQAAVALRARWAAKG